MYEIKNKMLKPNAVVDLNDSSAVFPAGSIEIKGNGNGVVLLLYTDNGGEVTVEAGDSVFAGASLTFELLPAMYYVVQLETGRFMKQSGPDKGKIIINTDIEDLTCNCFEIN